MAVLLTTQQTAQMLGIPESTLRKFRLQGIGPQYRKIGRRVYYIQCDVDAWLDKQRRNSTSE